MSNTRHEIERRFNITLPLDAAGASEGGGPHTAGELLAIVLRCVREQDAWSNRPSTVRLFRHVSGVLSHVCGVPIRQVRPTMPLADLMPRRERRTMWDELAERLRVPLPDLGLPEAFKKTLS
jgi:hypothetical protein